MSEQIKVYKIQIDDDPEVGPTGKAIDEAVKRLRKFALKSGLILYRDFATSAGQDPDGIAHHTLIFTIPRGFDVDAFTESISNENQFRAIGSYGGDWIETV
jgi:hypothetical protein